MNGWSDELQRMWDASHAKYADILDFPPPTGQGVTPMAHAHRAKQFLPFATMRGLDERLAWEADIHEWANRDIFEDEELRWLKETAWMMAQETARTMDVRTVDE